MRLAPGVTLSGIGFAWGAVRLNEARPGTLRVGANTFGSLSCHGFSHSNAQIRQTYGSGAFSGGRLRNFQCFRRGLKGTEKPCAGPGMKGGFLYELRPGPDTVCKKGDGPNPVLEILPCAQTKLRSLCETCFSASLEAFRSAPFPVLSGVHRDTLEAPGRVQPSAIERRGRLGATSRRLAAFGESAGASKAEGASVGAYEGRHFCGVLGCVFGGRAFENPAYERGGEGVSRPDSVLYLGRDGVG